MRTHLEHVQGSVLVALPDLDLADQVGMILHQHIHPVVDLQGGAAESGGSFGSHLLVLSFFQDWVPQKLPWGKSGAFLETWRRPQASLESTRWLGLCVSTPQGFGESRKKKARRSSPQHHHSPPRPKLSSKNLHSDLKMSSTGLGDSRLEVEGFPVSHL